MKRIMTKNTCMGAVPSACVCCRPTICRNVEKKRTNGKREANTNHYWEKNAWVWIIEAASSGKWNCIAGDTIIIYWTSCNGACAVNSPENYKMISIVVLSLWNQPHNTLCTSNVNYRLMYVLHF